ncbi:MAG: sulfite exporter TauE/SafE family protein [Nitrososphaerales archaeon]|nr:sulfite exporter TauE/SafE family protein [Nitrososphaerales archaeon]
MLDRILEILTALILTILAVLIGTFSSIVGVGGGFIIIPLLILVYNLKAHVAMGTSLTTVLFTAISATIVYLKQRRIDWKLGIITVLLTIPTSYMGAYSTKFFESKVLSGIFGIALALIGLRMILGSGLLYRRKESDEGTIAKLSSSQKGWYRKLVDASGSVFEYRIRTIPGFLLLPLCGFVASFLGVAGGIIIVPVYVLVMKVPIHLATATSLFTIIFTSISGAYAHLLLGNISLEYAIPLIIGTVTGAQIGTRIAKRLKSKLIQFIFGLLMISVGIFMAVTRLLM